jgi:peptidoglycan/xylan/chitin deacetylase (PgdA/CDA1 family)
MNLSISVKSILAKALDSCGIPETTIRNRSGNSYAILMYHRILPSGRETIPVQAGMYVDPNMFEEHILYLKRHFHAIPFSGKFSTIHPMGEASSKRPTCILTFDDGWRDFYEYAFPILERHRVPATVFLPTGYIGTEKWFWSDRLAGLLATGIPSPGPDRQGTGPEIVLWKRIADLTGAFETRLEAAIGMLKNRREREIEDVIARMSESCVQDPPTRKRVFLNWQEIREMMGSGLISFGSHTHNHRILVTLEEEEIREELVLSKEILLREKAVDPSFIPFCYPNGDWNDRIACMVREAGYHATVSTGSGWNREGDPAFELKRVAIHQDMAESREMFGCRVAGIL